VVVTDADRLPVLGPVRRRTPASTTLVAWTVTVAAGVLGQSVADRLRDGAGARTAPLVAAALVSALAGLTALTRARVPAVGPTAYWASVVLAATVARLASGDLTTAGVGPTAATAVFAAALVGSLAAPFIIGRAFTDRALTHPASWCAVASAFALGLTAWHSVTDELSPEPLTALVSLLVLAAGLTLLYYGGAPALMVVWAAYALVRPLGAVLDTLLTTSVGAGGLGIDSAVVTACLLAGVVTRVCWSTARERQRRGADARSQPATAA
jgi:uncharacterized membrane-anchored protein